MQRLRNRISDITADERFAKHIDNPSCSLRTFAELCATVAAHQNDRNIWSQLTDLARKRSP